MPLFTSGFSSRSDAAKCDECGGTCMGKKKKSTVQKFNPHHDPETGRFTSGQRSKYSGMPLKDPGPRLTGLHPQLQAMADAARAQYSRAPSPMSRAERIAREQFAMDNPGSNVQGGVHPVPMPTPYTSMSRAERIAREQFEVDNSGSNVQGGLRSVPLPSGPPGTESFDAFVHRQRQARGTDYGSMQDLVRSQQGSAATMGGQAFRYTPEQMAAAGRPGRTTGYTTSAPTPTLTLNPARRSIRDHARRLFGG